MSAHTPGPWETSRDAVPAGHVQITVYSVESGKRVATAFEQEANARLIAAAPELLEALTMVRDADNDCHLDGLPTIPPVARAAIDRAIAKATGTEL